MNIIDRIRSYINDNDLKLTITNNKIDIKKITPLFSTFSILEFNSEIKINAENNLSQISKLFSDAKR